MKRRNWSACSEGAAVVKSYRTELWRQVWNLPLASKLQTCSHIALVLLLVGVLAGAHCNRSARSPKSPTPTTSKVEAFRQQQSATMTPHGTIDMDSLKETPDGVEYRTSDGRRWRVAMEQSANGWRPRGEPEEVK